MNFDREAISRRLLGLPVVASALSLMTGTIITSLLGLVFWLVFGARLFEDESVGNSSTVITSIMLLAEVACLGLRTGLVRYIPRSGRSIRGTIAFGYAVGGGLAAIISGTFLVGIPVWAPALSELRSSTGMIIYVVASCVFWAIFMLQDSVLVAIGKSSWVPVENTIFSLAKLFLLFPFAAWSPGLGPYWAWTLPVFPVVLVINIMILRTLRYRSDGADAVTEGDAVTGADAVTEGDAVTGADPYPDTETASPTETDAHRDIEREWPSRRFVGTMMRFSLADWVSGLARLAAILIISFLVLNAVGSDQAAYFQVAWLMAYALFSVSGNAAYALLGDPSEDRRHLNRNSTQATLLSLGVTTPAVVVGLVGAPWILAVAGSEYADNATNLLRILLVAALPNVIHQMYIGHLKSRGRMTTVILAESVLAVIAVFGSWLLLGSFGIAGVGYAWLGGILALSSYALVSETVWWWASWPNTRRLRQASGFWRQFRSNAPSKSLEERFLAAGSEVESLQEPALWYSVNAALPEAVVLSADRQIAYSAFFAVGTGAAEDLATMDRVLGELGSVGADRAVESQGDGFAHLLPRRIGGTREPGREFTVWAQPAGRTATEFIESGWSSAAVVQALSPKVDGLHSLGRRTVTATDELVGEWSASGLACLHDAGRLNDGQIDLIGQAITSEIVGATIEVGRIHGGLVSDNILLGSDPTQIVGLRGWWRSRDDAPLFLDLGLFALVDLARSCGREVGEVVADLFADPAQFVRHPAAAAIPVPISLARPMLLLIWLDFVSRPHDERNSLSSEFVWLARNTKPVLAALEAHNSTGEGPKAGLSSVAGV